MCAVIIYANSHIIYILYMYDDDIMYIHRHQHIKSSFTYKFGSIYILGQHLQKSNKVLTLPQKFVPYIFNATNMYQLYRGVCTLIKCNEIYWDKLAQTWKFTLNLFELAIVGLSKFSCYSFGNISTKFYLQFLIRQTNILDINNKIIRLTKCAKDINE